MTLAQELENFVQQLPSIGADKRYWLVRTQSGTLFDSFQENSFVSLEHAEVPLSLLTEYATKFAGSKRQILGAIKAKVLETMRVLQQGEFDAKHHGRRASIVAAQVYKFAFELRKGDVVVIPSAGSNWVSFGELTEGHIATLTLDEAAKMDLSTVLKRRVKWLKVIRRQDVDPYLFRVFTAHQALNDVTAYADFIERSVRDFYILDDEAHIIVNVESPNELPASDVFGLGHEILSMIDAFALEYNLPVKSSDLSVSISLNSPGKIDLKSKIKQTTVVVALILAVMGGGYENKAGTKFMTRGLPVLMDALTRFLNESQDRRMRQQTLDKYKDSLQVKTPDDLNKLLEIYNENKDNSNP